MHRRYFVAALAAVGLGALVRATPAPKAKDSLVFRGETVSVFKRDALEIVAEGAHREYDSRNATANGYLGHRPWISWTVRAKTALAYAGFVSHTFYGHDCREQAEQAARTWVLAFEGGWPVFSPPEKGL
jgi:hypothetical protein